MVDWEQALATGSITGLFTFAALFGANHLLDRKRLRETRPVLRILPNENPSVTPDPIDLRIYNVDGPGLPSDLRKISIFTVKYKVNRIKVRNTGNSAAEDCKGMIIQDGIEVNVCWNIPTQRYKMTINAKSHEFLDLCAFLQDDASKKVIELKKNVSDLKDQYSGPDSQTVVLEEVRRIKYEYLELYPSSEDNPKLIEKYFPYLIAPTENDWQHPPNLNWPLKTGSAVVRITSKNASPIEYNIKILDEPDKNGKIIEMISVKN